MQAFALTLERSTAVSYPQSIVEVYYQLFIKNPTGSYNYLGYVYPLRYYSWIFVGLFLLWTPPFLYLTSKHSINHIKRDAHVIDITWPDLYHKCEK